MYDLPHFKAGSHEEVMAFMQAHPFIIICGCGNNHQPAATHVPVLIEEREGKYYLQGHIMRGQTHTDAFQQNQNVLAIFTSAHTYVSASWYKQKNIGSTWNYSAVHAQGTLTFKGETELHHLLVKLTEKFEAPDSPALVQHMKPGYVCSLMRYIIAFEIEITKLEHVFKLSQNRDEESYTGIIQHLNQTDDAGAKEIAAEMEHRQKSR